MPRKTNLLLLTVLSVLVPGICTALEITASKIQTSAQIISFLNLALFVTALISIKQFFWTSYDNRMPFHIFNIIFVLLFYSIGLPFLISNRGYYEEYQHLTPLGVLSKFFLSINISSFAQWVIVGSFFINLLYIKRYNRDYYQAGIADTGDEVVLAHREEDTSKNESANEATDPDTNATAIQAPSATAGMETKQHQ